MHSSADLTWGKLYRHFSSNATKVSVPEFVKNSSEIRETEMRKIHGMSWDVERKFVKKWYFSNFRINFGRSQKSPVPIESSTTEQCYRMHFDDGIALQHSANM